MNKKENRNLSKEEIQDPLDKSHESKLSDEELSNVAGGSSCDSRRYKVVEFPTKESVTFIANVGDVVERYKSSSSSRTLRGRIKSVKVKFHNYRHYYYDAYCIDHSEFIENGGISETDRSYIQKP